MLEDLKLKFDHEAPVNHRYTNYTEFITLTNTDIDGEMSAKANAI